jgi:uncharacterized protein (DUF983 family)
MLEGTAGPVAEPSPPAPFVAALRGICPRCGNAPLFRGLASFQPKCRSCGLDFSSFNVGDGPAAFLIFIVGGLVVGLAIWVELRFAPPFWVHILLWVPLTTVLTIGLLRVAKGLLLALEHKRGGGVGRLRDRP